MKAIVPLNITALKVSVNDEATVVSTFKGRTANFDNLPYKTEAKDSSTGDTIMKPLTCEDSPLASLGRGIHLHWELPDYFKKGSQSKETGKIIFPQAPNRWLVTRYLSEYNESKKEWLPPTRYSWVVESDYISEDKKKSIPILLPEKLLPKKQPYRFMGRVVDADKWPSIASDDKYLKDFYDENKSSLYLTAVGFLGATFSSYYPDCCSVFGFHDKFEDKKDIFDSKAIKFKMSYHVVGWIDGDDPCDGLKDKITELYQQYVERCRKYDLKIEKKPFDFLTQYAQDNFGWQFNSSDSIPYSLDSESNLDSIDVPEKILCNGIIQEIVWNTRPDSIKTNLEKDTLQLKPIIKKDNIICISIGNTANEALASLLEKEKSGSGNNREYLLNMLQSNRIEGIGKENNQLARIKKGLHSDGFAPEQGGLCWILQKTTQANGETSHATEAELPLNVHQALDELNKAQKEYDVSRESLDVERKQFFMDWYRYMKIFSNKEFSQENRALIGNFVKSSIDTIAKREEDTGILLYVGTKENNGSIKAVLEPKKGLKAQNVWMLFNDCQNRIQNYKEWQILAIPADTYQNCTDPVLAIEMETLNCKPRNGDIKCLPVRVTSEILDRLEFSYKTFNEYVEPKGNNVIPNGFKDFLHHEDIQLLFDEKYMLIPSLLVDWLLSAIELKGGVDNPVTNNRKAFMIALHGIWGGKGDSDVEKDSGIFNIIRQDGYSPKPNQKLTEQLQDQLSVTFTNSKKMGWLMHPLGWSTPSEYAYLSENKDDPFHPLFLIWKAKLKTIKHDKDQNYNKKAITSSFVINNELLDYTYDNSFFAVNKCVKEYAGSSILMKKGMQNISRQIEKYSESLNLTETDLIVKDLKKRDIVTLTLSGFRSSSILRQDIAPLPLVNLRNPKIDSLTNKIIGNILAKAKEEGDDWYAGAFNTEAPITIGTSEQTYFCPLRNGFLSLKSLEIVDVFGQRMQLLTKESEDESYLPISPSLFLSPLPDDKQHEGSAYLPPRLQTPSRLHLEWISDYSEKSDLHTMPACGWILPNHLDDSLFFYNSDGNAIGSFGIENNKLRYKTKAGNRTNPTDSLDEDLGTPEASKVDIWLAHFMRYIEMKGTASLDFFTDLIQTILDSEDFISSEKKQDDGSLSVLIGRPLAIARISVGIETYGSTLPLNQAGMNDWQQAPPKKHTEYQERMKFGDAGLSHIQIPVWLGDHYDMDDGLIGYIKESDDSTNPYSMSNFVSPSTRANSSFISAYETNLLLQPNAKPYTITALVDPCANVHAITGLLPVKSLEFPSECFSRATQNIKMTFFTHPLLREKLQFVAPLPEQKGYSWAWVTQHVDTEIALSTAYSSQNTSWGFSPQTLEEGWLQLLKDKETEK